MEGDDPDILNEFVSTENGPGLYDFLFNLIQKHRFSGGSAHQEINLNVFDLEIDHSTGMVSIHDILSPCRVAVMPLADVMARLKTERRE